MYPKPHLVPVYGVVLRRLEERGVGTGLRRPDARVGVQSVPKALIGDKIFKMDYLNNLVSDTHSRLYGR